MKNFRLKLWEIAMKVGNACGCHQMADRSFFIKDYQFPLCARCTGVWIGYTAALIAQKKYTPSLWLCLAFMLIMFADWFLQYKRICQSTNFRRLVTGILCGYGLLSIIIIFIKGF